MRLVRPVVVLALALVAPLTAFPGLAQAAGPVRAVSQPATAQPAQQPNLPPTLLPLLTQPGHQAALLEAAHAVEIPGVPPCPDASYATSGEIGVLDPPRLNAQGKIISGAWKEAILETGCGTTRRLNALTEVSPDGSLETRALLPGNTITDPELQEDSVQFAAAGMGELPPDCDQGGIVDTKFVGLDGQPAGVLPSPTAPPRPWSEIWTLQACSKRTDVVMHFVPDATGTSIHAALATK